MSIKAVLQRFSKQFSNNSFEVVCEEWDICRGREFDLLDEESQQELLNRIKNGYYAAVILSPPCASWSRAPWANNWGPRPLRTALYPWGMPWLEGPKLAKVAASNNMIRFCVVVIQTALDHPPIVFLLEHPENLGSVSSRPSPTVRPASIWELQEVQSLCQSGVFTVAFYQRKFGAKSRKPTRLLSNIPALRTIGFNQWPKLDKLGRYIGPLPPHCSCGFSHQGIIKRSASDAFATTQAAAYPEQMDLAIAWALWDFLVSPAAPSSSPLGGVPALQKEQQCQVPALQDKKTPKAEEQEEKRRAEKPEIPRKEVREEEIEELIEGARRKAEEELSKAAAVPPLGSAPLKVHYKGKVRNMVDGLGKCSLGVRPAGSRVKSLGRSGSSLAKGFWRHVEKLSEAMGEKERRKLLSRLALGQVEGSPCKGVVEKVRRDLDELVVRLGKDPARRPTDRATAIGFRTFKAWAELLGDQDHQFLEGLVRRGVPLGVRGEIPRGV